MSAILAFVIIIANLIVGTFVSLPLTGFGICSPATTFGSLLVCSAITFGFQLISGRMLRDHWWVGGLCFILPLLWAAGDSAACLLPILACFAGGFQGGKRKNTAQISNKDINQPLQSNDGAVGDSLRSKEKLWPTSGT